MLIAELMESSWNGRGSVPGYSDDTFASFTEAEEETCRQYENDPFDSYSSAVSERSESTWQSSSLSAEELEVLDSPDIGRDLMRKWITLLKDNQSNTELVKSAVGPGDDEASAGTSGVSKEAQGALQSFCAVKINQLRQPPNSIQPKRNKRRAQRHGSAPEKSWACKLDCVVPDQLVNRLHLQNIKETMKQLAEADWHQPSRCPHCQKKKAELAEDAFLRRKKTLLEKALLEEKLEELLYTQDSLTLIGEIQHSLPKLSEDPRDVWQKLNESTWRA